MFSQKVETLRENFGSFQTKNQNATAEQVQEVLSKETISQDDFAILTSDVAREQFLEELAQRAKYETEKRFGNTMKLYVPLYVSDYCSNSCSYCSFAASNDIERNHLSLEKVKEEVDSLHESGFKSLLIVAGEDKSYVNIEYLTEVIKYAKTKIPSVAIEIAPLEEDEYNTLVRAGLDTVTLYQETYNKENYLKYHKGSKRDYVKRIDYIDYAAKSGVRKIGLGALLGLSNIDEEGYFLFNHITYMLSKYWQTHISLSFPRLRPFIGGFQPNDIIDDKKLVQYICAFRIAFKEIDLVLSTRENEIFRDHMYGIGITQISAGSKTTVGGYVNEDGEEDAFSQFEIADDRSVHEIEKVLISKGFDPIWKDWEGVMYDTLHTEQ